MSEKTAKQTASDKQNRLQIATQVVQGLLASQNPEKGWNLDTLSILALKIADNLIHFNEMEKLPELITAGKKEE
jgi:predicted nuclease of restriction endonuclease-like (RecB) superfamily